MKNNFLKTLGFIGIVTAYWIMGVATSQDNPYIDVELQMDATQVDSFLVVMNSDSVDYNFDSFGVYYAADSLNNVSLMYNLSGYELNAGFTDSLLLSEFVSSVGDTFPIDSHVYIISAQVLFDPETGGTFYKEF